MIYLQGTIINKIHETGKDQKTGRAFEYRQLVINDDDSDGITTKVTVDEAMFNAVKKYDLVNIGCTASKYNNILKFRGVKYEDTF